MKIWRLLILSILILPGMLPAQSVGGSVFFNLPRNELNTYFKPGIGFEGFGQLGSAGEGGSAKIGVSVSLFGPRADSFLVDNDTLRFSKFNPVTLFAEGQVYFGSDNSISPYLGLRIGLVGCNYQADRLIAGTYYEDTKETSMVSFNPKIGVSLHEDDEWSLDLDFRYNAYLFWGRGLFQVSSFSHWSIGPSFCMRID